MEGRLETVVRTLIGSGHSGESLSKIQFYQVSHINYSEKHESTWKIFTPILHGRK
jgi:hypothetical protein